MNSQYVIFACNLFLVRGGVPDYTHNLANQLHRRNKLKYVVTPYGRKGYSDYDIRKINVRIDRGNYVTDKWKILSKIFTLVHYLKFYSDSYRELKKIKRDDVVAIFPEYYIDKFDILIFIARLLKIRYIVLFHGLDILMAKKGNFVHFDKNVEKAGLLIFNSQATRDLFNKVVGISKPSIILYPGIDIGDVESRYLTRPGNNIFKSKPEDVVFSTVAYLGKRKGIDKAIQIVNKLHEMHPGIKYYIGGVGEEREYLEKLVDRLDARNYIFFLGKIDDETKFDLLRQSDVFILPNYSVNGSDFEGFGISFIEASLCGNFVVGGNHGGAIEAVKDKITGRLFDFDKAESIDECVEVLNVILDDKLQMEAVKKAGEQFVRERYDWSVLINNFLDQESNSK